MWGGWWMKKDISGEEKSFSTLNDWENKKKKWNLPFSANEESKVSEKKITEKEKLTAANLLIKLEEKRWKGEKERER